MTVIPFSRVCGNPHGIIRKYGLMCCRQCFRSNAKEIGFIKLNVISEGKQVQMRNSQMVMPLGARAHSQLVKDAIAKDQVDPEACKMV
ncbi:hypothetical protein POTOM_047525 [Populus tomentosa]|uniref:40S ribosomal protein S29 n=1 Tax=Populus tomentosa TaxID=118781 RepID=A0A8X8CAX6_POPTO|nr:hypothetical protein POTOM_047525 [Populus tomentosa]